MRGQPIRERFLRKLSGGNGTDDNHGLGLIDDEVFPIEHQEYVHCGQRDALVAIGETVITREAVAVRGSELVERALRSVGKLVARARQRGLHRTFIRWAAQATESLEQVAMEELDVPAFEPDDGQLLGQLAVGVLELTAASLEGPNPLREVLVIG